MRPITKTRADLTNAVYRSVGLSRSDCARMVEDVLEIMSDAIISGDDVKISGFGIFEVRDKRERIGRNPKTGVSAKITARRVLTFRPSIVLKKKVNSGK